MSDLVRLILGLLAPLSVGTGCSLFEPLYVSELKTTGTWQGRATVIELVPAKPREAPVTALGLLIEGGPEWTDPGKRKHEKVTGLKAVLISDKKQIFAPARYHAGSVLRVRGLMRTDVAFDQDGARLYFDRRRVQQLLTIRVESIEQLDPTAANEVDDFVVVCADSPLPATEPTGDVPPVVEG